MACRALTTDLSKSSLLLLSIALGCADTPSAQAEGREIEEEPASAKNAGPPPETSLGVVDVGIFSDIDSRVQLPPPRRADRAVFDPRRGLLTVYRGARPLKIYPGGPVGVRVGDRSIGLRPGDAAELEGLDLRLEVLGDGQAPPPGDVDGDGIADPLDLLIGARKTALNGARYGAGYIKIDYPMGDVPRDAGVCTDVVIRAVRNLGVDLQVELHRDIRRARRAYPMVKRLNANINHRRVRTLLPYFRRHWQERSADIDDPSDPLEPGDVVFMDTFPSRPGPDHIGIVSDRAGPSGKPMIINNWTEGSRTGEMDLLSFVPVTHRFRFSRR